VLHFQFLIKPMKVNRIGGIRLMGSAVLSLDLFDAALGAQFKFVLPGCKLCAQHGHRDEWG
jgi:hypothetical protein